MEIKSFSVCRKKNFRNRIFKKVACILTDFWLKLNYAKENNYVLNKFSPMYNSFCFHCLPKAFSCSLFFHNIVNIFYSLLFFWQAITKDYLMANMCAYMCCCVCIPLEKAFHMSSALSRLNFMRGRHRKAALCCRCLNLLTNCYMTTKHYSHWMLTNVCVITI